ncbi:MAG TPA: hypothetical protein VMU09_01855, partial [Acidimicrobiales bacterium]|nr:hypothetical protein [Acidimicrobiales bacterium]
MPAQGTSDGVAATPREEGDGPGTAAVACVVAVSVLAAAGLVAGFDAALTARVHAGTDSALRLSVILPYLGVDSAYVLARSLGLAALVVAAAALVLGLDGARRQAAGGRPPPVASLCHRVLGLLVVVLVAA